MSSPEKQDESASMATEKHAKSTSSNTLAEKKTEEATTHGSSPLPSEEEKPEESSSFLSSRREVHPLSVATATAEEATVEPLAPVTPASATATSSAAATTESADEATWQQPTAPPTARSVPSHQQFVTPSTIASSLSSSTADVSFFPSTETSSGGVTLGSGTGVGRDWDTWHIQHLASLHRQQQQQSELSPHITPRAVDISTSTSSSSSTFYRPYTEAQRPQRTEVPTPKPETPPKPYTEAQGRKEPASSTEPQQEQEDTLRSPESAVGVATAKKEESSEEESVASGEDIGSTKPDSEKAGSKRGLKRPEEPPESRPEKVSRKARKEMGTPLSHFFPPQEQVMVSPHMNLDLRSLSEHVRPDPDNILMQGDSYLGLSGHPENQEVKIEAASPASLDESVPPRPGSAPSSLGSSPSISPQKRTRGKRQRQEEEKVEEEEKRKSPSPSPEKGRGKRRKKKKS